MRVFLIDDDQVSNFIAEQTLLKESFAKQVRAFTSAETALETITKELPLNVPDFIFLDINMPVMNGWQFLDALEPYKEQIKGKCYIYILTSSLRLEDTLKSKDYELVAGLIHKPLSRDDVKVIRAEIESGDRK